MGAVRPSIAPLGVRAGRSGRGAAGPSEWHRQRAVDELGAGDER